MRADDTWGGVGVTRKRQASRTPCVYILASKRNGTLYTGVTSDLVRRVWEHRNDLVAGFSERYRTHLLVWFERHETMESAIVREKRLKEWSAPGSWS